MERTLLPAHPGCFGCGLDNPKGLRLQFYLEDGQARAEFRPTTDHAGYEGLVHGGLISLLFDEAMGMVAARDWGRLCFSAELKVRFLQPMPLGETFVVVGELVADKKRIRLTRGEIRDPGGQVYARATGKYLPLPEHKKEEVESLLRLR
ncbi:MAG: PaaI family thioesterase [Candidatus Tectomicrobia bacterium]|uniref:PaaI family thioesterase n=1 Tax=Tectimicrobiota bacterium TaxID=2528274 RepID=A0A932CLM0_UNCTE|nr:PaaI family thioesterase [Candidatus Tectomicrobia bacterium]